MTRNVETEFHRIVRAKGWTLLEIGERWGLGPRQMTRIAQACSTRDLDSAQGLPNKTKKGKPHRKTQPSANNNPATSGGEGT